MLVPGLDCSLNGPEFLNNLVGCTWPDAMRMFNDNTRLVEVLTKFITDKTTFM